MKISTNSALAKNKPGWIDFNAGVILENEPMEKRLANGSSTISSA